MSPQAPTPANAADAPPESDSAAERHTCFCGKSYVRKEHLRRHQAIHEKRRHVCSQCGAAFTRKDILRRHIKEHSSSTRRSKACDACHINKTKCDGNGERCSLCRRRGIACLYSAGESRLPEPEAELENTITVAEVIQVDDPIQLDVTREASVVVIPDGAADTVRSQSGLSARLHEVLKEILEELGKVPSQRRPLREGSYPTDLMRKVFQKYIDYFHPQWVILHAPTYEFSEQPFESAAIVFLIGTFCWNQADKTLGIEQTPFFQIHGKLMDHYFRDLSGPPNLDVEAQPWPSLKYQGILLTIIFATFLAEEESIQRARLMAGLFVNTLRTVDFLCSRTATRQRQVHFPGDFFPWKHMHGQQRSLIVSCFLKIDAHLAILTQQPPHLESCELDVSLPDTFAELNGYGIDVFWARRNALENVRRDTNISSFLNDPQATFSSDMLIEDIHIGICGLAAKAWRLAQLRRVGNANEEARRIQTDLVARLLSWRKRLQTQKALIPNCDLFRSAYFGEHEQPDKVMSALDDETLALYHLVSLLINTHAPTDLEEPERLLDPDHLSKAALLPPLAMKSVYHTLCIGALSSNRQGCRPPILHHARIFAREFLESMLEGSCWCGFASSRLELALKDIRLDAEDGICAVSLGQFWLFVNGVPLCACERSSFLTEVGLG